jgi:hypothetical protein
MLCCVLHTFHGPYELLKSEILHYDLPPRGERNQRRNFRPRFQVLYDGRFSN